jgi:small subunit ribosomal protein S21
MLKRQIEQRSAARNRTPQEDRSDDDMIEVKVSNDQVDRAMRDLKRKLIKEGLFKELSRRKFNIKPSLAKRLKRAQAEKVRKKEARRERERMER